MSDETVERHERSAVKRRLATGFGVNIVSRGVGTLIQVVSVPIFLSHWSNGLYGEWLILNSVPTYFAQSDVGFGSAAGNDMTMLMAAGDQPGALDVFQSVLTLTTVVSASVGAAFLALVWWLPFHRWLNVHSISPHETHLVLILLTLSVLLSMQETLYQAAFRCVAKYAYGTFLKSMINLAAFAGVSAVVIAGGTVVQTAAAYFLVNAAGTLLLWIELRRSVPWIRFGIAHARMATLRRLAVPAVSFMALPVGNALNLQGILLVVGHVLGPVAVVIFATARTVSRTAVAFLGMIQNTIWPEMSSAVGAGDMPLARSLHRRACQISIAGALGLVVAMVVAGPWIWPIWTRHSFPTDPVLLDLLLALVVFSSLWMTSIVAMTATNRQQQVAAVYLAATGGSLIAAWGMARLFGLRGVAVALIAGEAFMAVSVLRTSLRFLGDTLGGFVGSLLRLPKWRHG